MRLNKLGYPIFKKIAIRHKPPTNPKNTIDSTQVTYQSLNCRNPFHNIGFIYFCLYLKYINIMFRKTFTSSSHKKSIYTAVSDINKVEVSTLLNRNIDVNYQ